jgi:hypothetical protein
MAFIILRTFIKSLKKKEVEFGKHMVNVLFLDINLNLLVMSISERFYFLGDS